MSGAATMTESDLSRAVIELAELLGWRVYSIRNSRRGIVQSATGPGYPDLTLVKPPRVVFAELKVGRNRPTAAQEGWLEALDRCPGVESHLWTDLDWSRGTVEAELRRGF